MHEIHAYWKRELAKSIASGGCTAVCYCVDLRVRDSDAGTQTAVLFIHLEDSEGFAEDVLYTYDFEKGSNAVLGKPTIENSDQQIFSV